jgi:hypothetical protein
MRNRYRKLKYRLSNVVFRMLHDQVGQHKANASDLIPEVPSLSVERRNGWQTVSRWHLHFQHGTIKETTTAYIPNHSQFSQPNAGYRCFTLSLWLNVTPVFRHHAVKTYGGLKFISMHSWKHNYFEVNCEHFTTAFSPGKHLRFPLFRMLHENQNSSGCGG